MGICPDCTQYLELKDLHIEKNGKKIVEQERMYSCPFCNCILGFSYAMR